MITKELKTYSATKRDDSKRKTPDVSKRLEEDFKRDLQKLNKNDKFQVAYKKLIVKSIIFNFEKKWYDDSLKDLKKLESVFNVSEEIDLIFINITYAVIEYLKGNSKGFNMTIDMIIQKLSKSELKEIKIDESFPTLIQKVIYNSIKSKSIFLTQEKVVFPFFENFNSFKRFLQSKDHILIFSMLLRIMIDSKSPVKIIEKYIKNLKENPIFEEHTKLNYLHHKDNNCLSIENFLNKFCVSLANSISFSFNKSNNSLKNNRFKESQQIIVTKQNNSFDSGTKKCTTLKSLKDSKISNFQKYIKNIKHIKERITCTPISANKATKSSNISKDHKKNRSESNNASFLEKKNNILISEKDENLNLKIVPEGFYSSPNHYEVDMKINNENSKNSEKLKIKVNNSKDLPFNPKKFSLLRNNLIENNRYEKEEAENLARNSKIEAVFLKFELINAQFSQKIQECVEFLNKF